MCVCVGVGGGEVRQTERQADKQEVQVFTICTREINEISHSLSLAQKMHFIRVYS